MITLQDIVLFEQLRKKSFLCFDASTEDVTALMYVHDHTNRRNYTLKFYSRVALKEIEKQTKETRAFIAMVQADMQYISQFSEKKEGTDEDGEKKKLTPVIETLMFQGGLDAEWLLRQGLDMLPILCEGYEKKEQQEQEKKRFWTLLQIQPHMQSKDFKRLRDNLKFPWEKPAVQQISESLNNKIARFIFGKKKEE